MKKLSESLFNTLKYRPQ